MGKLHPKQQKFVDAYDGNAHQAALAAGYSPKTAQVQASRLLTNVKVIAAIKAREEKPRARRIATREDRQAFWTNVMNGNERDIAAKDGEKIEIDVQMKDRLKAAELLGRSEADFTDKIQADMNVKVVRKEYKK